MRVAVLVKGAPDWRLTIATSNLLRLNSDFYELLPQPCSRQ